MAKKRKGIAVWRSSVGFLSVDPDDPEMCGFYTKNPAVKWDKPKPVAPEFSTLELIRWSVKVLGEESAELYAPYVALVGKIDLLKGKIDGWGDSALQMRSELFELEGHYGPRVPEEERRAMVDTHLIQVGDLRVTFEGDDLSDGIWKFSHREFPFRIACEVAARVLRDVGTRTIAKKYYVPFLITRPESDWDGMKLRADASLMVPVADWQPLQNAHPGTPEDVEDGGALSTADPGLPIGIPDLEGKLSPAFVLPKQEPRPAIALNEQDGRYQIVTIKEEHACRRASEDWGVIMYVGDGEQIVRFPDWKALTHFCTGLASASDIGKLVIPVLPDPPEHHTFPFWLAEVGASSNRMQREVRAALEEAFQSNRAYQGVDTVLQKEGYGLLLSSDDGEDKVLLYDSEYGYTITNRTGGNPWWSREELVQLICVVLGDPLTLQYAEEQYAPFLISLLNEWRQWHLDIVEVSGVATITAAPTIEVEKPQTVEPVVESGPTRSKKVEELVAGAESGLISEARLIARRHGFAK